MGTVASFQAAHRASHLRCHLSVQQTPTTVIWYGSNMIDNLCETSEPPLLGAFDTGQYASGGSAQASGMVAIPCAVDPHTVLAGFDRRCAERIFAIWPSTDAMPPSAGRAAAGPVDRCSGAADQPGQPTGDGKQDKGRPTPEDPGTVPARPVSGRQQLVAIARIGLAVGREHAVPAALERPQRGWTTAAPDHARRWPQRRRTG